MKHTALKRRPKRRASAAERQQSYRWYVNATADGCVMCRHFPPEVDVTQLPDLRRIEAHHVLPKSALKQRGMERFIWSASAPGMGLCAYHHPRHTHYIQRVPRALVSVTIECFALLHNLCWLLDEEYPP